MSIQADTSKMIQALELDQPKIAERDRRYRGIQPLRFHVDEIEDRDLRDFSVNICRLAVNSVAERMKVKSIHAEVNGRDVSDLMASHWDMLGMDQRLQSAIVEALAIGSAYLIVWADKFERPYITVESASQVAVARDPITNEVTGAIKRWFEHDHQGIVVNEHVVHYGPDQITRMERDDAGGLKIVDTVDNPLGVVPVVPLINHDRITDQHGYSVVDDLGPLVDVLSKLLADMVTSSEHLARPKRFATGVTLQESPDGFSVDDEPFDPVDDEPGTDVANPFDDAYRMWISESPDTKFGQLPGGDLTGYKTAVDVIMQQIMAVAALPAHMVGITTANPASADATRAAEASLSARAENRARALTIAIEYAVILMAAIDQKVTVDQVTAKINWRDFATRSQAQEADAITKLHSLGIVSTDEAREMIGVGGL